MSRLHKLTFYTKLQDLFESFPPHEIPQKIGETISFIESNLEWYGQGLSEIDEGLLALKAVREAFEDSLQPTDEWTFCLTHPVKGYAINLRVYYNFLHDNDDFPEKIEALADTWHVLINNENIGEFQQLQGIVTSLKYTFGLMEYSSW